jgi:predicted GNAT family acetyltransferase
MNLNAYFLPPKISLPYINASGELRRASSADMPVLLPWIKNFYSETLHAKPPDEISAETEKHGSGSFSSPVTLFVWHDTQPVAMGMLIESQKTCRINLIYVAPKFRGKNYGKAIVCALAKKARDAKQVPVLYAADENTAAVKLYTSLGFVVVQSLHE